MHSIALAETMIVEGEYVGSIKLWGLRIINVTCETYLEINSNKQISYKNAIEKGLNYNVENSVLCVFLSA